MFIPYAAAKKLDVGTNTTIATIIAKGRRTSLLPIWMQKMDTLFLAEVQSLHDNPYYWKEKGLSESGKTQVGRICKNFNLPIDELSEAINQQLTPIK